MRAPSLNCLFLLSCLSTLSMIIIKLMKHSSIQMSFWTLLFIEWKLTKTVTSLHSGKLSLTQNWTLFMELSIFLKGQGCLPLFTDFYPFFPFFLVDWCQICSKSSRLASHFQASRNWELYLSYFSALCKKFRLWDLLGLHVFDKTIILVDLLTPLIVLSASSYSTVDVLLVLSSSELENLWQER